MGSGAGLGSGLGAGQGSGSGQGGRKRRSIAYFGGVGVMAEGGSLVHTHSARPIRAALASLAGDGEPLPDLVVADHGWCGGAGQAGIDAIGFADSNDPALFVGEAEGVVQVAVPLDDGIAPRHYAGLVGYVLGRGGLVGR